MKTRTLLIAAAVALVVLVAAPFALAQRGRAMHADASGMILGHLSRAKQALGLSDQQVSDIEAIFQTLRQQNQAYRESLRGTMQQVAQTLINNPNDVAAAQALLDQQTDTERAMKANALNAASKALSVLTPDQRTKLSTILQEHMNRLPK